MSLIQEKALDLLELIKKRDNYYSEANSLLQKLQGDFPSTVQFMDASVFEAVIKLLDVILGDELASYYIYECTLMKGGGAIHEREGKVWTINSIESLRKYVFRNSA